MAMKEMSYYEGRDLVYPTRVAKPFLKDRADVAAVRKYADDLEAYNSAAEGFNQELKAYRNEMSARQDTLVEDLAEQYGLTRAQADVLYAHAYADGHSSGLSEVVNLFDDLVTLVTDFQNAKKEK